MKQALFLKGFVFAVVALPLVAGCKKKETGATAGSAAPAGSAATMAGSAAAPAAGSGSAVVAAAAGSGSGSGSAAEPVAPWANDTAPVPATSKVTGKRDGNAAPGTFDRAIFFEITDNYGTPGYQLHLTTGCDKLSCSDYVVLRGSIYSDEKFGKDCPGATEMDISFDGSAAPKVGPVSLNVSINGETSGGALSANAVKGSTITAISDKEVKGKISVKEGNSEAMGEFTAKNCGSITFPKQY